MPTQLGPYPIEREVGRGGMGVVYLARDTRLGREKPSTFQPVVPGAIVRFVWPALGSPDPPPAVMRRRSKSGSPVIWPWTPKPLSPSGPEILTATVPKALGAGVPV